MLLRYVLMANLFFISTAWAESTVSLSGPNPALAASYAAGQSQTVVYTITNNVPNHSFPITIGGISAPLSCTTVSAEHH